MFINEETEISNNDVICPKSPNQRPSWHSNWKLPTARPDLFLIHNISDSLGTWPPRPAAGNLSVHLPTGAFGILQNSFAAFSISF